MRFLFAVMILAMASVSLAQPVDRILLVSDITSADMLIAKVAAEKHGAPVLILENGTLTDDVSAELSSLDIKTVILVGGPAVISNKTEADLEGKYTVIRLWGNERTGTAIEVAKFFWTDADCAVLVDDTKNSDADTSLQTDASQVASSEGCVFLPVPRGKVPAEVATLLSDLGTRHAKLIGSSPDEFRSKLSMNKSEISASEIVSEIKNKTEIKKLIIIAAPHWRDVLGQAGHSGRHTLVRIASSNDSVPSLIELTKQNNITDIRVLGNPALAEDIAEKLEAAGINATKISGTAREVAIKAARESWSDWQQSRKEAFGNETNVFSKSKNRKQATSLVNRLENELNKLEQKIDANANATAAALLKSRIDNAQSQLGAIRDYITNDNLDTAKRRTMRLFSEVRKIRWMYRTQLNVDTMSDVSDEED